MSVAYDTIDDHETASEKLPDTIKVLSMKIAPGQESRMVWIEANLNRMRSRVDGRPYLVRAEGSTNTIALIEDLFGKMGRSGSGVFEQSFASRSDANLFYKMLQYYDGISIWLAGPSPGHAVAQEVPLLGYVNLQEAYNWDGELDAKRTERLRAEVYRLRMNLMRGSGPQAFCVVTSSEVLYPQGRAKKTKPIALSEESGILIPQFTGPSSEPTKYIPIERRGEMKVGKEMYDYCWFSIDNEVREYFKRATNRYGIVWLFKTRS